MLNLEGLQKNFQAYLLQHSSHIQDVVRGTKKVNPLERLNIYRDAYYSRLMEALYIEYPVLHALLKEESMQALAKNYIGLYPSTFRSIRRYGENLVRHMQRTTPYIKMPWLIEMAEFEWGLSRAFDAEDASFFEIDKMASIPIECWHVLQFKINPSLQRRKFSWNVVQIWKTFNESNKLIPHMNRLKKENWIIWRKNHDVQFCSLAKHEMYILNAMMSGSTFGSICEGLCQWIKEADVSVQAASVLKRLLIDGIVVDVCIN